jgi:hypothetical protein
MFNVFNFFSGEDSQLNERSSVDVPPMELFMQHFSERTYDPGNKLPAELVKLDIEILSLADSLNLGQPEDINYVAKFLASFCKGSESYNVLSKEGKERIDSIYSEESPAVRKAIIKSGCTTT